MSLSYIIIYYNTIFYIIYPIINKVDTYTYSNVITLLWYKYTGIGPVSGRKIRAANISPARGLKVKATRFGKASFEL